MIIRARSQSDTAQPPLTIGELIGLVNQRLVGLRGNRFRAEVISCQLDRSSGHRYLTLKDDTGEVRAALWQGTARRVATIPEPGQTYVFTVQKCDVYAKKGTFTVALDQVEFDQEGQLRAQLEELRKRLEAEGAFAPERKRRLPLVPKGVALVTSQAGAVIHDLKETIEGRFPNMPLYLYPVQVQGIASGPSIVAALRQANRERLAEVIVLARGGGNFLDMFAFNTEEVVRAVLESALPVVSAVGHTKDVSLTDQAADLFCLTPTDAGVKVVPERNQLLAELRQLLLKLEREAITAIERQQMVQQGAGQELEAAVEQAVSGHEQAAAKLLLELEGAGRRMLDRRGLQASGTLDQLGAQARSSLRLLAARLHEKRPDVNLEGKARARIRNRHLRLGELLGQLNRHDPLLRFQLRQIQLGARLERLMQLADQRLAAQEEGLERLRASERLARSSDRRLALLATQLDGLLHKLDGRDPERVLRQGYSITQEAKTGKLVRSSKQVKRGSKLKIVLAEGELGADVSEVQG